MQELDLQLQLQHVEEYLHVRVVVVEAAEVAGVVEVVEVVEVAEAEAVVEEDVEVLDLKKNYC